MYLSNRPKLSAEEARDRYKAYFRRAFSQMIQNGDAYAVVTGAPGTVMATANWG
jgi:hypothetical protein